MEDNTKIKFTLPDGIDMNGQTLAVVKNEELQLLESVRIQPDVVIEKPEDILSINDIPLMTLGNTSLIIGKAKSMKSFFIMILLIIALNGKHPSFEGMVSSLPINRKKILYFDTEQGEYHVYLANKRILTMTYDDKRDNISTYHLRKFKPSQRLKLIETAIYNNDDVSVVIIDGIKDLVHSINDEEEATNITSDLLRWTQERNIHIISVLHQNKSDNNARGHLGTELINKCETVLSVAKDDRLSSTSIVQPEFIRGSKEPDPIAFTINDSGMPEMLYDYTFNTKASKEAFKPESISETEYHQVLEAVFTSGATYKYTQLKEKFKAEIKTVLNKSIGDNKVKDCMTYCKTKNWITQEEGNTEYIYIPPV